jgi:outer membrane protein, multidrug efflux system
MSGRALTLAALALALSGCLVGPDYRRPDYPVPATFRGRPPEGPADARSFGDLEWWAIFQDPELISLIRTALAENYDVRVAASRILDARAQVVVVQSFLYPTINAAVSAPYTRFVGRSGEFDPQLDELKNLFLGQGGFDLGYEIDLWGRIRRGAEAARAQLFASVWVQQTIVSRLVTDVAGAYFQLRALDEQLAVARRTLASRQRSLELVVLREQGGVASLMDVRQAEVLRRQAAEAIPQFERLIEQTENVIAILLGLNPGPTPRGRSLEEQVAAPAVPPGLTSDLLDRRPDIREAEQQLVAANAQIGVAKAQLFPLVTLTGTASVGGNVFNSMAFGPFGIFGIAPSISLPLFNAGRLQAGVDSAASRTQEAILRYQQTIQQAFREVDDALVAYAKNREFRVEKQELVATLLLAVDLANIRYQGGVTSYLEVLDLETRLFTAELDLVVASLNERTAVVQLYRALGGGWKQQAPQAGPPTTPAADEMRTAEDSAGHLPPKRDSRVGPSGAGSPATGVRPAPGPQALQPVKR